MKLTINRDTLLPALTQAAGVTAKKAVAPVLSNLLMTAREGRLEITGSNMDTSMTSAVTADIETEGAITVPARKLLDIVKASNKGAELKFDLKEKMTVRTGRSRFTLATIPATDYPSRELPGGKSITLPASNLSAMLASCAFAMAQNDVRYYLNGLLFQVADGSLHMVATDGHRLATARCDCEAEDVQAVIPRDAVNALQRLISGSDGDVVLVFDHTGCAATVDGYTLTTKLIDGKFPDWTRVIPASNPHRMTVDADDLRGAMSRAAILSSDKYKGVRMTVGDGGIKLEATNPEQEQATEELDSSYDGPAVEIGFNVAYMLEALGAIEEDRCEVYLKDGTSAALVLPEGSDDARYVIMPMRL